MFADEKVGEGWEGGGKKTTTKEGGAEGEREGGMREEG